MRPNRGEARARLSKGGFLKSLLLKVFILVTELYRLLSSNYVVRRVFAVFLFSKEHINICM